MLKEILRRTVIVLCCLLFITPIYFLVTVSLKRKQDIFRKLYTPFVHPRPANYSDAWQTAGIGKYFFNSTIITGFAILLVLILALLAAYMLTRSHHQKISRFFYFYFTLGLTIPVQVGMIPLFLLLKKIGLYNSLPGIILAYTAYSLPVTIFLMSGFFITFPQSLEEAAVIDGCGDLGVLFRILAPLSKPIIISSVIYNMVIIWNDIVFPLILIKSEALKPISIGLLVFRGEYETNYAIMFAAVVIASLPLTILYGIFQSQFISGITAGAIKG